MIMGYFHEGSGLGNQLHRYVMTRVLGEDNGYWWGMINPEKFKGSSFMNLTMTNLPHEESTFDLAIWKEKKVVENGVDIRGYDPEINFILDNTVIDGEFQDERYFGHRLPEIDTWLRVDPIPISDDTCVIGFRGGEFSIFPDLFLTKDYWHDGIAIMQSKGVTKFEVHTDDEYLARQFFPDYHVIHDVGINWRSMRYAKHAIIANSSFYILPRLLNGGYTIAPRYWARRNTKVWALPQNYYKSFLYI